jgi:anthranilate synthase/aminodeoxychorismate synthase-like glutamine amidotransferase
MIVLIDNYDSFVHNLARHFVRLGQETMVIRNDALTIPQLRALCPTAIVISPGPKAPADAGCSLALVRELHREIPLLGVCLGHQAIAQALGGKVVRAAEPLHGRASYLEHNGTSVFAGLPSRFRVGRYHSLTVEAESLPVELQVTARSEDGQIMACAHSAFPTVGLQFHPESILTEHGYALLANFLRIAGMEPSGDHADLSASEQPRQHRANRALPVRPVTF